MSGGLVAVVVLLLVCVLGFNECAELDRECVPLHECPELLHLLKEVPLSQKALKSLKTSHCGFEELHPKVWCTRVVSNCKTPNGIPGKCIPVKECVPFLQAIRSTNAHSLDVKNYLQMFQCGDPKSSGRDLSVCCPPDKESIIVQPANTLPSFLPKPSEGECGQQLASRIIGGSVTEMEEFPWTVLLEYDFNGEITTGCGGSLISKNYVLTAAHCVDSHATRRIGDLINVILGEFDTRNETDCINVLGIKSCADPPVRVPVQEVTIHPQWFTKLQSHINYDIALLRLSAPVTFTDYIKPICLPSPTLTLKEQYHLVVTGWGQTETASTSFVKRKTTVPVANRNACIQKYKDDKRLTVGDGELCAGGEEGIDSCSGDSGSPLMMQVDRSGNLVWFLVGIVSFGPNQPCGQKDYPALYTYLPKYIDWIYKSIRP